MEVYYSLQVTKFKSQTNQLKSHITKD